MGLDVRIPIGLMFGIFGVLLVIYGLLTNGSEIYQTHSLGININLWWGLAMLVFGGLMLLFAKSGKAPKLSGTNVEEEDIEKMEKERGLES